MRYPTCILVVDVLGGRISLTSVYAFSYLSDNLARRGYAEEATRKVMEFRMSCVVNRSMKRYLNPVTGMMLLMLFSKWKEQNYS